MLQEITGHIQNKHFKAYQGTSRPPINKHPFLIGSFGNKMSKSSNSSQSEEIEGNF